jgi:hypothetical protein
MLIPLSRHNNRLRCFPSARRLQTGKGRDRAKPFRRLRGREAIQPETIHCALGLRPGRRQHNRSGYVCNHSGSWNRGSAMRGGSARSIASEAEKI